MPGKINAFWLACIGVVAALICAVSLIFHRDANNPGEQAVYGIPKTVSYSYTIQNTTNRVIEDVLLLTHSPVNLTATQKAQNLRTSFPYRLITDALGNQVCQFSFDRLVPFESRIVNIRADLMMAEQPNRLPAEPDRFLSSEKYIEADDQKIVQLARSLKLSDATETAGAVLAWMDSNLKRSAYIRQNRGARQTLNRKKGDCTGFMQLFVALCRAAGVPARCVGGYICPENAVLKPAEYHNWAEFYADGFWYICDPFNRFFIQGQTAYVAMRIIDYTANGESEPFDRFKIEGTGVKAKMNS